MTSNEDSDTPGDEATVRIEAPPERIWSIVTDIAGMGRLSPECTGGAWLDGATVPAVGARFKGHNKRGFARWSTTNTVVTAEVNQEFAFETKQSAARWRYVLTPDGTGTTVTETRELFGERSKVAVIFTKLMLGGEDGHTDELRRGMQESLRKLKALAESKA
jgi:uncharacterized protein YndB with AHSA1/START domain